MNLNTSTIWYPDQEYSDDRRPMYTVRGVAFWAEPGERSQRFYQYTGYDVSVYTTFSSDQFTAPLRQQNYDEVLPRRSP